MSKKVMIAVVLVAATAAALYQFAGFRVQFDGSGRMPRFVTMAPDYDALEADRARQREESPSPAVASDGLAQQATAPPASSAPAPDDPAPAREAPHAEARASAGYWPDFRGPNRDGRYSDAPIRTDWLGGLPLLWKQPIGLGYASFVVAEGRAFTIEQRREQEVAAAYDLETGRELWTNGWDGEFVEAMGGDGPRATPTYDEGRVYVLGALGELRCLDARTGALVWRHNILMENEATNLEWGMSASPLIVDEQVIVLPGGRRGKSVVAYHKVTGEMLWTALDDRQAYTSPMLVTIGGVRQILIVSAARAAGLAVDGGRLLWEYPWANDIGINVAQPLLLGGDRIFLSSSYGGGAAVFEVRREGDAFATHALWSNQRMKNRFTSSVVHEGYIYGLDEAILACLDAATGEQQWKGGRYGYGQLMIAGDRLIVLTEDGELVQVRATPERHDELARFGAISGKTWNHPVIAGGRLLVRNLQEMAAFDISVSQGADAMSGGAQAF